MDEFGSDVKVRINFTVAPVKQGPKGPESLHKVKNIIAVASGKGGVGKSTVTANMAAGLAKQGYKVGLVDADIYGPSMPLMFDIVREKPKVQVIEGKQYMVPVESYGVKVMSLGFFALPEQAVVWRGAMATKALKQMFGDVYWGELDYLLLDLPPGTGDVHLTIVQTVPVTGAIVVSTPQEVALADARKGVAMFKLESINVPVIGLVENMAWFTPAELPENKYYIFGKDGVKGLAEQLKLPLLGQIPLVQSVREAGDVGRPALLQDNTPIAETFKSLAEAVVEQVDIRNKTQKPTEKVEITTR
jgi:ATP-binding protein involved in chromosome partitioning